MCRYVVGITWSMEGRRSQWSDGKMLSQAAECALRFRRHKRWFEHVMRGDESEALMRVSSVEVPGREPPGRLNKTWMMSGAVAKRQLEDGH